MARLREPGPPRTVPLADAAGLILAEDLVVPRAMPEAAVALRAGYAVASSDLVGVSAYAPLHRPALPPWVAEGERLPAGLDAVIAADAVVATGPLVEVTASASPGENVRRVGEDAQAGQCLGRRGEPLRPLAIAVAQALGLSEAAVRPATILVLADEADRALAAAIAPIEGAFTSVQGWRVDPAALDRAVGDGAFDLVAVVARDDAILRHPQGRTLASGLALGGAETVRVVLVSQTPVVLLPPRLDAVVAAVHGLIQPFINARTGRRARAPWRRAPLTRKLSSAVGLAELALVRETMGGLEPLGAGSLSLGALANADGFLVIPPESEGFQAGEIVEAHGL